MKAHLKLIFIKYTEQVVWNEFVETLEECFHFLLDVVCQTVLSQRIQVLVFGAVCYTDLRTTRNQLDNLANIHEFTLK